MLFQGEPRDARCRCKYRCVSNFTVLMERLCTLNTATLSTRTRLAPSQHKTPWLTFGGHSRPCILRSLKSRRGTVYYCIIMWALESDSKISKERSEHLRFWEPHCHSAPPVQGTPANFRTNLLWTRIIHLQFAAGSVGLSSLFFSSGLRKTFFHTSAFRPIKVIQGYGTNRNCIRDFLLVRHRNLGFIS